MCWWSASTDCLTQKDRERIQWQVWSSGSRPTIKAVQKSENTCTCRASVPTDAHLNIVCRQRIPEATRCSARSQPLKDDLLSLQKAMKCLRSAFTPLSQVGGCQIVFMLVYDDRDDCVCVLAQVMEENRTEKCICSSNTELKLRIMMM